MVRWYIEIQNSRTFEWERLHPTLDGVERVFPTKRAAEEFGYDYQLIGQPPNAGGHRFVSSRQENRESCATNYSRSRLARTAK